MLIKTCLTCKVTQEDGKPKAAAPSGGILGALQMALQIRDNAIHSSGNLLLLCSSYKINTSSRFRFMEVVSLWFSIMFAHFKSLEKVFVSFVIY